MRIATSCAAANTWAVGTTCTTGICAQLGGCCQALVCTATTASGCNAGRSFAGAGSVCGTTSNPIACCPANFNRVNGLDNSDVTDFMSAWFAMDPRADFDHNGVFDSNDVFAFLNAWSAGC